MADDKTEFGTNPKSPRATISFSCKQYQELERLSEEKKVSVAWVVRDAVDQYLEEKWPLLEKGRG